MMKNSLLVLLIACMISCTSNTIYKKPSDLIPKDSMVLLISDLYLASSSKVYKNKFKERNIDYTFLVFEKYGIDSSRFKSSNHYYTTKIDDYEKIYKEVEQKLKGLNNQYKTIKKKKDSIKTDSVIRLRFVKDSIKKAKKDSLRIQDSIFSLKTIDSLKMIKKTLIKTDSIISKNEDSNFDTIIKK